MVRNEPAWNARKPQMPINKHGHWISYPGYGLVSWETVHQPFPATMEIDGMQTGRSSKLVILKDVDTGKTYPMFVSDLVNGVSRGDFTVEQRPEGGRIIGLWTGSKKGANYGIKAVRV